MPKLRSRIIITVVLTLVITTMLAGCGGGMLGTVLKITGATAVLSDELSSSSSIIRILADVTGEGIKKVIAYIKKLNDDDPSPIVLEEVAPGTFEGTFEAEEGSSTGQPDEYSITVKATDTAGNQAVSEPISVEVPPTDGPSQ